MLQGHCVHLTTLENPFSEILDPPLQFILYSLYNARNKKRMSVIGEAIEIASIDIGVHKEGHVQYGVGHKHKCKVSR